MSTRNKFLWLVVIGALGASLWYFWAATGSTAAFKIESTDLSRGNVKSTISASGTVTPKGSVSVGSQVSGQILEVLADYNDRVAAGDILARIDSSNFDQRVHQATADLDAAKAQVQVQISQAAARQADVSRANVSLSDARRDLARKRELLTRGFISTAERDSALTIVRTRREDLRSAVAAGRVAAAQIDNAKAIVAQREAALNNARLDFGRTIIRSPIDGIVIKRTVDAGQTVAASLQAPELFVIARNLTEMRVEASVDESDIGQVRQGMPASFTVDAFPAESFDGKVEQIRVSAENSQNVITYVVLVEFENSVLRLLPGMTANVQITTSNRQSVLRVPNTALRVRVPAALLATDNRAKDAAESQENARKNTQANTSPGQGGRGRLEALREKLIVITHPSADQIVSLNAVFARAATDFKALRTVPAEQRNARAKALRAQMRRDIADALTPEQLKLWQDATGGARSSPARVYKLDGDKLRAVDLRIGLTDGSFTEVVSGLSEGDVVATAVKKVSASKDGSLKLLQMFR